MYSKTFLTVAFNKAVQNFHPSLLLASMSRSFKRECAKHDSLMNCDVNYDRKKVLQLDPEKNCVAMANVAKKDKEVAKVVRRPHSLK